MLFGKKKKNFSTHVLLFMNDNVLLSLLNNFFNQKIKSENYDTWL